MYVPEHFSAPSTDAMLQLVRQHPLGILFTNGGSGLDANHIPFELAAEQGALGTLHAHVARNNPVWTEVRNGDEVLVVFRGEEAYISPNWYPSKQEHHKQVPTWNYKVVHAHGRITIRDDERYVRGLVAKLTRTHEASEPKPWKMTDAPKEYMASMMLAIVGIEIEITRLAGKFKLSQNKDPRDIHSAATILIERGHEALGESMRDLALD
ncbi:MULTISPECIES: FMN-binding negative transcriptional regulator [Pseudomonadaceae]|uniref:FMN-binding negative transcriptional regulator n=1 Tax=Pseudomonadaceae TaxID=135621 RepID=UPI0015E38A15|nr:MULTISPECIES: FMN-binding negative transcriptional regulator [Pseudomonadaceae]MBA1280115.1 FMN-binding negative transcriptional regulator [Stutzerimonas stutzeri]MBC8651287.1 FMN-binding negative transcriptional regulator [Pseudomonas sp. MT4]QXY91818.1 FMN-binding negative transcriptional regulator [Pseudomonas sp. MTM4]